MDVAKLKSAILFDLLKVHTSETFCRQANRSGTGDAWQAVAKGLSRARFEQKRDACQKAAGAAESDAEAIATPSEQSLKVTEDEVRQRLVQVYMSVSSWEREVIIVDKLKDELSYFSKMRYRTVQEALEHWQWYLFSLTFKAEDFESKAKHEHEGAKCMPLDTVDLQILAVTFETQITVSHMLRATWRFQPSQSTIIQGTPCSAIHLVHHEGLWEPLLGPTPPEDECRSLSGSVVEIGDLESGALKLAAFKPAVVLNYDHSIEAYIASKDQVTFPVERNQVNQVLFYEGADNEEASRHRNHWATRILDHIPNSSLQFQILYELVRKCGKAKLEEYHASLAGRAASGSTAPQKKTGDTGQNVPDDMWRTAPTPTNEAHPSTSSSSTGRSRYLEVKQVINDLKAGRNYYAVAVRDNNHPFLRKGDQMLLEAAERTFVRCSPAEQRKPTNWFPIDCFTTWEVTLPFQPEAAWANADKYLALQVGQNVAVTERYAGEWNEWASGCLLQQGEGQMAEGIFHLSFVESKILVNG